MKVRVTWTSGGKEVEVEVSCQTATVNWAEECAAKVKEAVEAMEKIFPRDTPPDKTEAEKVGQ